MKEKPYKTIRAINSKTIGYSIFNGFFVVLFIVMSVIMIMFHIEILLTFTGLGLPCFIFPIILTLKTNIKFYKSYFKSNVVLYCRDKKIRKYKIEYDELLSAEMITNDEEKIVFKNRYGTNYLPTIRLTFKNEEEYKYASTDFSEKQILEILQEIEKRIT